MRLTKREEELNSYELRSERGGFEVWYKNQYTGFAHPLESHARAQKKTLQANHYTFRNHPFGIMPAEKLWCVQGEFKGFGSGVLEWCWNQAYAEDVLAKMQKDWRFVSGEAAKFKS